MDLSPGTVSRPENELVRDDEMATPEEEPGAEKGDVTINEFLTGAFAMAR